MGAAAGSDLVPALLTVPVGQSSQSLREGARFVAVGVGGQVGQLLRHAEDQLLILLPTRRGIPGVVRMVFPTVAGPSAAPFNDRAVAHAHL